MTEVEQPSQNGIELTTEEDENNKARPADIEQDMREMERRKRVEAIMGSRLFREELERIVDSQIREGGASGILQQLSDIVGVPTSRVGSVFKSSNCVLPINDIRGVESMGYSKGEKILRCKLAAAFRLLDLSGWSKGLGAQITARLKVDQELFLVNPYGLLFHEVTASSLNKVDMQGNVVEQGTTNFGVNKNHFILHSVVHAARPDIRCAIYIGCNPVVAVSSLKVGLLPLTNDSVVLGEISTHQYTGCLSDAEEREKLVRNLGPVSKVMLLTNHGALCCGETIEEAYFAAHHIVQACETQLKLLPVGVDNLVMIPEESRKTIYDAARRPPEDIAAAFEKKAAAAAAAAASASEDVSTADESQTDNSKDTSHKLLQQPKWRVGGAEFEAWMRMLDNAGFRTGYIYRHPLIKSELPKAKNDVEVPPAVSSLGYLLEEEELYRQGIWKKGDWRKGGDRSRWLNSPNVYQKVEVLETGTPDPKKITKWVAEGSPTHSTPVRIEGALQFVPPGTNPKEFKKVQQQIKDNRRADKISAGPQSHILEGVTWDEANRIKDATVSSAGDHVVLMGAASKGIIQRGFQHNATVYKAPYAKNPFDNVTDDELNEYKRTVERKKNIHGEYTDTDFSESEALSSLQTSGAQQQNSSKTAVVSQSETEDASEHQVMRIETKQAPVPSQPEVVLSDATLDFLNGERQHTATIKNLPSPRAQTSSSTNTTNKTPVEFNKVYESEQTGYQETDLALNTNTYPTLDGSYHHKYFTPMFADNFSMHHTYFEDLMQQNMHFNQSLPVAQQYWMLPLNLEITTSEVYPINYNPECSYPVVQPDIQSLTNSTVCNVPYSKMSSAYPTNCSKVHEIDYKPYRTLSHFGFNYPKRQTPPEHYHIPVYPSKYVPIKKSLSYDEIFSSPRYVDLCDICFEKVLRLRPEVLYCKPSGDEEDNQEQNLRNRVSKVSLQETDDDKPAEEEEVEDDGENFELLEAVKNWLDNEQQLNVSRVLEPVIEVDEEDQVSIPETPMVDYNSNVIGVGENSTFLDKITRMNYSEESTNVGFQPWKTVTSDITMEADEKMDAELAEEISYLTLQTAPETDNVPLLSAEQPFSDDRTADVTSSTEPNSDYSLTSPRKLMSREERNQRKQEFTELWEDHIEYFTPKQLSDSDNESDLERNKSEIFYGESRLSSMSLTNDADVQSISSGTASATYRITSPSSSGNAIHVTPSLDYYSLVDSEPLASDSELNSMERIIIDKIEENHLKDQEQIFDDIEKTIRHKMTPSKLERLVKKRRTNLNSLLASSTPEERTRKSDIFYSLNESDVEKTTKDGTDSGSRHRRSSSLISDSGNRKRRLKHVPTLIDLSKVDQDHSPLSSADELRIREIKMPKKPIKCPKHSLSSDCVDCQLARKRIKRNFVAENIQNASKPRRRCNVDKSSSSTNAFGNSASTPCLIEHRKGNPPVYSFQTKSGGSPRFWVTLSPRNKDACPRHKDKKENRTDTKCMFQYECEPEGSGDFDNETKSSSSSDVKMEKEIDGLETARRIRKVKVEKKSHLASELDLAPTKFGENFDIEMKSTLNTTDVEKQIDSLGQEIDALKPRLNQYKKTIDEYGEQIAKVSHSMDDVMETQNEIEDSRQKLREDITMNQYIERVCCDVQTFSISEADD